MLRRILFGAILWCGIANAHATLISYSTTNISSNTWQYNYSITNNTLATAIDEFTIFFDFGLYSNLAVSSTPIGWDPLVIQPDPFLGSGFYDALALGPGIALGATLGGFSVQFSYLGSGTPGAQLFDIVDPFSFATIDSGTTVLQVANVPEPSAIWLLGAGLLLLFGRRRITYYPQ